MQFSKDMWEKIKRARLMLGKPQDEIAAAIGISRSQYSRYENGESDISYDKLVSILKYLSLEDELLHTTLPNNKIDKSLIDYADYSKFTSLLVSCHNELADTKRELNELREYKKANEKNEKSKMIKAAKSLPAFFLKRLEAMQEDEKSKLEWRDMIGAAHMSYESIVDEWHQYQSSILDELNK